MINKKTVFSLIVLIVIAIGTAVGIYLVQHPTFFQPKATQTSYPNAILSTASLTDYRKKGYDPDLKKQCARSNVDLGGGRADTSYQLTTDCLGSLTAEGNDTSSWFIGAAGGDPAVGPCNYKLGDPNGAMHVNWYKQPDSSYYVQLYEDFVNKSQPCNHSNSFNWISFMDHAQADKHIDLPRPDLAAAHYKLNYGVFKPNVNSNTRVMLVWGGRWTDTAGQTNNREIELMLNPEDWADGDPDPRIVVPEERGNPLNYLGVSAAAYGISLPKGQDVDLVIDWSLIIKDLANAGYLKPPADWTQTTTNIMGISMEVFSATPTNSIVSDLMIKQFTPYEKVISTQTPPSPSPSPSIAAGSCTTDTQCPTNNYCEFKNGFCTNSVPQTCYGKCLPNNAFVPAAQITAAPNPCIIPPGEVVCTSHITWTSQNAPDLQIRIKETGGTFTGIGNTEGSGDAPWISEDGATFEAYSAKSMSSTPLASLLVKGVPAVPPSPSPSPIPSPIPSPSPRNSPSPSASSGGPVAISDIDRNGAVELQDFNLFVQYFRGHDLKADVNGSGSVELQDFNSFVGDFRQNFRMR